MNITLIRCLLWLCVAVQAAFFFFAWTTFAPAIGSMTIDITATGVSAATKLGLTGAQRAFGAALDALPVLVLGYGLWRLDRLLLNFRRQDLFTPQSVAHLRAFAGATLAATLLAIVELPLRTLGWRLITGARWPLQIGLTGEQAMLILVCGLFYLVTRMMQEGGRLAQENEGFI